MSDSAQYLVVGGDSLVGGYVFDTLKSKGLKALSTTRRVDTAGPDRIVFDFEYEATFAVPKSICCAFVVAAATEYNRCEVDPNAYRINVELIPRAVLSLIEQGVFVVYISTNSVFGGDQSWPSEYARHSPGIAYAKQKSQSEVAIAAMANEAGYAECYNVVRLTKILDATTPPLPSWIASWRNGNIVTPFSDLIFAPMSPHFVSNALVKLGEKRISGNFHLSGSENVSYVDLAYALAEKIGISRSLIESTTATEKGVHIAFKPRYSGIGMDRTTKLCGIQPQSLSSVIDDIF